ncbi:hypothetical protein MKW92_018273 [Papaver armeniacum]|nr:hypothetical protein MKW92_018273 [Papaver armeniacum]
MGTQTDRVRFNVRGKIFETTATTLASAPRNSMFGAMFDDDWNLQPKDANKEEYFIDRNPDCFSALLDLLGTGELHVPPNLSEKLIYREALYYGILDHVKAAKLSKFDCNWLKLKHSVRDQAPGNCTAIRANPDGGCAVAHGGIVRVYDWMLEEHPPLNLDYQIVNDIEWIDSDNIVMSVCQGQNTNKELGGMGVFSSSTRELKHRFLLSDGKDQLKGFDARALCFNSDGKIYTSCEGLSNSGIGVWDQVTGKQIDFFDAEDGLTLRFGKADKIQWLNGRNCLFVNSCVKYKRCINLLDFRDKSIVSSITFKSMRSPNVWHHNVVDAIPLDESDSICVVSNYEDLGFVDLRNTKESVKWNLNCGGSWGGSENRHPKLKFHGGQLFCSLDDKISVYHGGPDQWVLTSRLARTEGGSIRDFSIGGDRLFAIHGEENVLHVWETPSGPII